LRAIRLPDSFAAAPIRPKITISTKEAMKT
jgi:hypothetical protein